jgi:pyrroline-5-carboxylate reductase
MAVSFIQGLSSLFDITIAGRNQKKLKQLSSTYKIKTQTINQNISQNIDITNLNVLIAIKPYAIDFLSHFTGKAKNIFSILAGVKLETIKTKIESISYTRVMPNVSALYNSSITTLYSDDKNREICENIFSSIGDIIWLDKESDIDIATVIASSSVAYLAMIAEALEDGSVNEGLTRDISNTLIKGLFKSFTPLIENKKASDIKDMVMSPNGVTIKGYAVLEKRALRGSIIEAVSCAHKQAKKLS